ncbi:MAG: SulP family inorganic anion transporter [Rhodospirillaceae bacterium]|nr:SulP family inorganic anion transporter [Rhodospirillaceae bacterium]MBT5941700.1 SulP family inorganic anion transporter [Rhodospirillaceae bacterium]
MALRQRPFAHLNGGASRIFPFLFWMRSVNRSTINADLMAAFTGAMIMIPQGVAFATIAGMPPEYGLYAGMIPAIVAALFGSSWHLVSGPTTAASILIFSSIGIMAEAGTASYVTLVLTLTFMVGVIELVMGLARLGSLINFISHTVAIGFTAGAAILIAASQARDFLGLEIPRGSKFYDVALIIFRQFDQISPAATSVGLITIISGLLLRKYLPKSPYMIVAMLFSALVAFALDHFGVAKVPTIGAINSGLPPLSSPDFSLDVFKELAPTAFAVALFALTEAVSIARSIASKTGQQIDGSQEFIGQGLSNIVGGFFSGYVATGSFNRSALNFSSGAKTPMAAAVGGVILLAMTPFVAPFAEYLPKATVAGILFLVISGLIDGKHIRQILTSSKSETTVMLATFFAVLFINLEVAIFTGVILSLVFYLNRTSHPKVSTLAPDSNDPRRRFSADPNLSECPQVKIIRIDGSLFFGAVSNVVAKLRQFERNQPMQKNLVVVTSGINFIDMEGAEALANEARRRRNVGGHLCLIGIKEAVSLVLKRTGFDRAIGADNIFESKTAALSTVYSFIDQDICATCPKHIFQECGSEPADIPRSNEVPTSAVLVPEMPAPSRKIEKKPDPVVHMGPSAGRKNPARILALIEHDDGDDGARETMAEAQRLAEEVGAELAFGQIVNWNWGSGNVMPEGFLSEEMETALCAPARQHLKGIAADLGISNPAVMATATPNRSQAAVKLIAEWCPDLIVIHERSNFEFARQTKHDFETPFGQIHTRIKLAG